MIYRFVALSDLWAFVEQILEDEGGCTFDGKELTVQNVTGASETAMDWLAMDIEGRNCRIDHTGDWVKTVQSDKVERRDWTDEGWASKKFGITGMIMSEHTGHGLCYEVDHGDGTTGFYDPLEVEFLP